MKFVSFLIVLTCFMKSLEGVKILPVDLSMRIELEPLFEQVQVANSNIRDNRLRISRRVRKSKKN